MTEKETSDSPKPPPSEGEGDLENLSPEEKAAFEKIMSQIGDTEGDDEPTAKTRDSAEEASTDEEADDQREPTGTSPTSDSSNGEMTAEQQAALDKIMAEINGNETNDDASVDEEPAKEAPDEDSLSDEEQAALDKIMQEIKPAGAGEDSSFEEAPASDASPGDTRNEDRQTARAKEKPENKDEDTDDGSPSTEDASSDDTDGDSLTEDQQAALDKIMAEINGGDTTEPSLPREEEDDPDEAGEGDLTEDQQAAMDKIMAEIKGDDSTDDPLAEEEDSEPSTETAESDEEMAAVDDVMAKINAQKQASSAASTNDETPDESDVADEAMDPSVQIDEQADQEESREQLTLDEFNEELNHLLGVPPEKGNTASQKPSQAIPSEAETAEIPEGDSESPAGYPILEEVVAEEASTSRDNGQNKAPVGNRNSIGRKFKIAVAALMSALILAVGGYWAFDRWAQPARGTSTSSALALDATAEDTQAPVEPQPTPNMDTGTPLLPDVESVDSPFTEIKAQLASARQQLQEKINDIDELKAYYGKGIDEERQKILARISKSELKTFKQAEADSTVELSLQAIQRRTLYIAKLDRPLEQLAASSERFLYLERRTRMLEVLHRRLNGLPIAALQQDTFKAIADQEELAKNLSIDGTDGTAPTLAALWDEIVRTSRESENTVSSSRIDRALDAKIGEEVCRGDFGRKYLLTSLTARTAGCLADWSGKDLYLNNLVELPPEAAQALTKWPGEWMSLNGLQSISAQTARHLAQWPGKRLSLNGLTRLSPQATANLSQWKGEQLEMVGLTDIGGWENYGTRLYLSEALKRKLKLP